MNFKPGDRVRRRDHHIEGSTIQPGCLGTVVSTALANGRFAVSVKWEHGVTSRYEDQFVRECLAMADTEEPWIFCPGDLVIHNATGIRGKIAETEKNFPRVGMETIRVLWDGQVHLTIYDNRTFRLIRKMTPDDLGRIPRKESKKRSSSDDRITGSSKLLNNPASAEMYRRRLAREAAAEQQSIADIKAIGPAERAMQDDRNWTMNATESGGWSREVRRRLEDRERQRQIACDNGEDD